MSELRPAAVICRVTKNDPVPRILTFDDHNDAWSAAVALGRDSRYCGVLMVTFEHYTQGRMPADLPDKQEVMFK